MSFFIIGVSLPLGDDPPANELSVVIILGNMEQYAISREKLVVPQQIGVEAKDSDIIRQTAKHPVYVLPTDNRLSPALNEASVFRLGGVPHRGGGFLFFLVVCFPPCGKVILIAFHRFRVSSIDIFSRDFLAASD